MEDPKTNISTILTALGEETSAYVYQENPEVIQYRPSITYSISSNVPDLGLDKSVAVQNFETTINIWADTSIEAGTILTALFDKMLENGYRMTFNTDIIDDDGGSHIVTRFNY